MQYSTALSDGLLALACLACAGGLWRRGQTLAPAARTALLAALLGLALPAAAAASGVLHYGLDARWSGTHQWLSRASSLIGLPLLGIAAFSLGRQRYLRTQAWAALLTLSGLLALTGSFAGLGRYGLLLNLLGLGLLLAAGAGQWPRRRPLLMATAGVGLLLLAGLAVGTQGFIGSLHRVDLFHLLLSLAYPLLSGLILALPGAQPAEKMVKTL